jgi:hypothetical protein
MKSLNTNQATDGKDAVKKALVLAIGIEEANQFDIF